MKLTNYSIVFSILFVVIFTSIGIKINTTATINRLQITYNRKVDNAVDDAAYDLLELGDNRELILNKDQAIKNFYNSLYANFGVLDNKWDQMMLNIYVPIIMVTDLDGFYLLYNDAYQGDQGEQLVRLRWTEKIPYSYEDSKAVYSFYLGEKREEVRIYDKERNEVLNGKIEDLKDTYPIFRDKDIFDQVRRISAVECIRKKMNYYVNRNNKIAEKFGITYEFSLPTIADEDWDRTIDDISIMAIFQGYPFGTPSMGYFNRYVYSGARINKNQMYYIQIELNGKAFYHRKNCKLLTDDGEPYSDKRECAIQGAYPCDACKP